MAAPCAPLLNIEFRDDQFVVRQAAVGHRVVADRVNSLVAWR